MGPACTWASGAAPSMSSGLRSAAALIAAPSLRWGLPSTARPATRPRVGSSQANRAARSFAPSFRAAQGRVGVVAVGVVLPVLGSVMVTPRVLPPAPKPIDEPIDGVFRIPAEPGLGLRIDEMETRKTARSDRMI